MNLEKARLIADIIIIIMLITVGFYLHRYIDEIGTSPCTMCERKGFECSYLTFSNIPMLNEQLKENYIKSKGGEINE